jgi:acyl carrier protein phosphodiesterase
MNHLAHLFLAGDTDESLLGNLSGDFVKGRLDGRFPPAVERGIAEHRLIDAFTDTHPEVAAFRRIVGADHGHYSRVISDIFFDHFLATGWHHYAGESLEDFLRRVFARLDRHVPAMPGRLRIIYPRLRDERWLQSYASIEGIRTTLFYISRRFSREPRLESAARLLVEQRQPLQHHFQRFMPDVIAYAKRLRSPA